MLKTLSFADFEEEMKATRRVLERLPTDRLDWKPHARSNSLGELGAHVANIVGWLAPVLDADGLDFAGSPPPGAGTASTREIVDAFEANVARARAAVEAVDEAELGRDWTLRFGEHVVFTRPKLVVYRSFGMGHLSHHRGQLTVYLRLLDVPLPPVYGPTADER